MRRIAAGIVVSVALAIAPTPPSAHAEAENWVLYHQQVAPSDGLLFAGARAIIVSSQRSETGTTRLIHAEGAAAYHYLNVYRLPLGHSYAGIDLAQHPDWQFCGPDGVPKQGRAAARAITARQMTWAYPDLNERGMHDAIIAYLRALKEDGYDGVFFDRGTAALGVGAMPNQVSSCTSDPVAPGATFADAYARVLTDAGAMGLRVVLNYDTRVAPPLRTDVAGVATRILLQTAPHARAQEIAESFARRRAEEAAASGGAPRYLEEVKTDRAGDRRAAFFEWAKAALWRVDIAINSGNDGCAGTGLHGVRCWRYGTFPQLTRVARGAALTGAPRGISCRVGHPYRCLWVRTWRHVVVAVNETAYPISMTLNLRHATCRVVRNLWSRRLVHHGACVRTLTTHVPAYSGRVFTENSEPSTATPRIYWGAFIEGHDTYGSGYTNAPWDENTWNLFEAHAGKHVSILHYGVQPPWVEPFAADVASRIVDRGAIPFMDMASGDISLAALARGDYDASWKAWATAVKAWGHPFLLRWDYEMNGPWFPWGTAQSAADYVTAWRHIHDVVAAAGASNVTWVWCPSLDGNGSYPIASRYPGDAYVDWLGIDGYQWNTTAPFQSYDQVLGGTLGDITALSSSKPVVIAETASREAANDPQAKAAWTTAFLTGLPTRFPQVKALVWFNWRIFENGMYQDWPIESSPAEQAAFATGIASSVYQDNHYGSLPRLSKVRAP